MKLRSPPAQRLRPTYPIVECAQCGAQIFAPDWSEYLDDRRIRHLWVCEACDYQFETMVRLAAT